MREEEDVKNLVSATVSFYGGLHFAVNNAGVDKGGRITDLEVSDFDDVIATNLRGVWLGTKYALAYMQDHGGGRWRDLECAVLQHRANALPKRPEDGSRAQERHSLNR